MDDTELIQRLNNELEMELPQHLPEQALVQKLSEFINHLIQADFQKLVRILYKADVNEDRLKLLLQKHAHEDAAPVIANLIIEREQQKINSRRQFSNRENIPEEEKW